MSGQLPQPGSATPAAGEPTIGSHVERLRGQALRDARMQKLLTIAAVLAVVGFTALIYLPSMRRLQSMHERIYAGSARLSAEERRARRLPHVRSTADRLAVHLDAFKPLPAEPGQAAFLLDVSELARRLQLRGLQYQPMPEPVSKPGAGEEGPPLRELPIRLQFRGDFVNVFNFLRQVEELPRLLRVREVVIQQDEKALAVAGDGTTSTTPTSGEVRVEMIVSLYFRPSAPMLAAM